MGIDRFLVVDEVEANILFFTVVLGDLGFKAVFSSPTGTQALSDAAKHNIQFVIAAWEMQEMPGTLLLQRLRAGKRKQLPFLIYSKRMSAEDLVLTRELGLPNVLSLPLDRERAKAEIKALIDAENAISPEEARLRKMEAYLQEGKPNEALQLFDAKLRKKGPSYVRALTLVGQTWLAVGQFQKAEKELKCALEEDPSAYDAANLLASLYSKTGRHDQAIAQLARMREASPKNITTLLNLGNAYVDADRHDEAKQTFETVSTLDPDNPTLKDERGKLAFKEGDLPLAAKLLAETQNGDALARHFNNLAIALTHAGKFDQAIGTYESAIKLLGNRAKLHALRYNLGLALVKKGDLPRGFEELAKSYKGDPSFEKAYAALVRVSKQMSEQGLAFDKGLAREINALRKQERPGQADGADKPATTQKNGNAA